MEEAQEAQAQVTEGLWTLFGLVACGCAAGSLIVQLLDWFLIPHSRQRSSSVNVDLSVLDLKGKALGYDWSLHRLQEGEGRPDWSPDDPVFRFGCTRNPLSRWTAEFIQDAVRGNAEERNRNRDAVLITSLVIMCRDLVQNDAQGPETSQLASFLNRHVAYLRSQSQPAFQPQSPRVAVDAAAEAGRAAECANGSTASGAVRGPLEPAQQYTARIQHAVDMLDNFDSDPVFSSQSRQQTRREERLHELNQRGTLIHNETVRHLERWMDMAKALADSRIAKDNAEAALMQGRAEIAQGQAARNRSYPAR